MIASPRRSVTRFFVPLIDVLLLLFCIFLLMPFVAEEDLKTQQRLESVDELDNTRKALMKQIEVYRKSLEESQRKEVAVVPRPFAELAKGLGDKTRLIDISKENGEISYFDPKTRKSFKIDSKESAENLFRKLEAEAGTKNLYYLFLMPREDVGYPTESQEKDYKSWFKSRAHSLEK